MNNNFYTCLVSSLILVWLYSSSLPAQEIPQTSAETELSSESDPTEAVKTNPYNVVLGSFLFRPELAVSERYDSNIFALRDDEIEDTLLIIEPSFLLFSNWKEHLLKLGIGGEAGRYHDYSSEDYDDYWIDLQGRYDFSDTTNVFGGVNHTRDHEESGTPSVVGTFPTSFDSDQAHVGFAHRSGNYKFRLGGTFEQLDFDDSGPVNNDDRDREVYGLGFRASYLYSPDREVFVQAISDERDYKTDVDDNGFERDSSGHRLALGFKGRYSNRLSAETYVGQIYQEFDDSRFDDVDTPTFYTKVSYLSSARSKFSLIVDQSLEETTLVDASSYLSSTLSLQGLRQLSDRNTLTATFSAGIADYQDAELEEDIYSASFEWQRRLTPEFYMALDYRLLLNDANQSIEVDNPANPQYLEDYVRQQVMLTLNSTLFRVDDADFGKTPLWETLNTSKNDWGGFYLGGKIGHGATQTRTSGTRGEGTDTAEFSNSGTSAGLFAGYGINRNRWYLGLEVEADRADQDIFHTKDKASSLSFQVDHVESYAVSLRGGHVVKSGSLLYARVGKADAEFDTQYSLNNEPENAVDKSFDVDGTRYGIGTDIPLGDSVFLRMDYAYTKYHS
ncbi:MAG: outer membrane beta-barrel protein, partial [Gammaproteobacteria bacterium]